MGVTPSTVGACRPSLSNLDSETPAERTYTTKHGATATMNVRVSRRRAGAHPTAANAPRFALPAYTRRLEGFECAQS